MSTETPFEIGVFLVKNNNIIIIVCVVYLFEIFCMKWLKKIIVYIFMFWIISNLFFWYTFADQEDQENESKNCAACRATPSWMQMYLNFEIDLLWILQSASAQPEKVWKNKRSWLFAGGILSVWKVVLKSTVSKIKDDFDSEIKAVRALNISTVLLYKMTLPNVYSDGMLPIAILFENEPFVRDYKTLQEIDMSVDDVIREMWINWLWSKKISSQIYKKLDTLQSKYTVMYWGSNAIFEKISISGTVKYRQLLTFILRLNSLMKAILYNVSSDAEIEWFIHIFENFYSKGEIVATINRDVVDSMMRDYSCATTVACNTSVSTALKQLKKLMKNTKKKAQNSWGEIEDSWSAFKNSILNVKKTRKATLSKEAKDTWLTDKQIELLYSVYGIDAKDLTTSQIETLKQNWVKIKEEFVPLTEAANNIAKWSVDLYQTWKNSSLLRWTYYYIKNWWKNKQQKNEQKDSELERQKKIEQLITESYFPLSDRQQAIYDSMQETVNVILLDKYLDKQIALVSTNRDTHYFLEIWKIMHIIIEKEIWTKDTEWLVKRLWETCIYQCTNKWTTKCYAK